MRVLGLDLAQTSAAAWRNDEGALCSQVRFLGKRDAGGMTQTMTLLSWMQDLMIVSGADTLVIEQEPSRGAGEKLLESFRQHATNTGRSYGAKAWRMSPNAARRAVFGVEGMTQADAVTRALTELPIYRDSSTDEVDAVLLVLAFEKTMVPA